MINLETVKALRALRLPGMANELESQLEQPQRYRDLKFEDRLAMLVDAEQINRRINTVKKRMDKSNLTDKQACIEMIEYYEDRHLDKGLITELATCQYIRDHHHVVIRGATGTGKTYIANALGTAACQKLFKVRYVCLSDLLNEYAVAKATNTQNRVKAFYAKQDLLIIDEWLLRPLPEEETFDLHELINACDQKGAIIFCTQYDPDDWYFRIDCDRGDDEDSAVTEAILDRIINNRYNVILESSVSMRKRHGFIAGSEGGRND